MCGGSEINTNYFIIGGIYMHTKRSPTKNQYFNSRSEKKQICEIRKLFNKSCRNCVYFDNCKEKEIRL